VAGDQNGAITSTNDDDNLVFRITKDKLFMKGHIEATSGSFTGHIDATSGTIGGIDITALTGGVNTNDNVIWGDSLAFHGIGSYNYNST
jgi:hypothetical protein